MDKQLVRGDTRLVGLVGWPVAHSLSPLIHNHAFSRLGLNFVYVALPVQPADLASVITALRHAGFAGANITIPHKQAVMACCDSLSELSRITGAVNTLYFSEGSLCGTTTDAQGFDRALAWMGHDYTGGHVVILGNGGTARTLASALALSGRVASITLVGRDGERVGKLAAEIGAATAAPVQWTTFDSPALAQTMARATLCVNCTSVGMHPHEQETPLPAQLLHAGLTVFDAIYNPVETRLLAEARRAGCAVQNGMRMLLYQGLASFTYWTGVTVDDAIFAIDELQQAITHR